MAASLSKNTSLLTLSLIGQKILSFSYFAMIARSLGATTTGEYALVLSFTTLFSILTDFGFTPVVIREVARERDLPSFTPELHSLLRTTLIMKFIMTMGTVALTIFCAWIIGYPSSLIMLIAMGTLVMVLDSFHLFFYGILRGLQDLRFEALGMFISQFLVIFLGAIILYHHGSVMLLIGVLAVGSLFNVGNSVIRVVHHRGIISFVGDIFREPYVDRARVFELMKSAWPFTLAGILARGYSQLDVILLGAMLGTTAVGIYSVPSKMVFAFQFIPLALSASLYPALAHSYVHSKEKMTRLIEGSMEYLSLIAIPLIAVLLFFGSSIIETVFGTAYQGSIIPLFIISGSILFGFLDIPVGALLNATGNQKKQTLAMGLTFVSNVILNVLLIPKYGATGAAIAAVSSQSILFFSGLYFSRTLVVWPIKNICLHIGKLLMIAGAAILILLFLQNWSLDFSKMGILITSLLLFMGIFVAGAFLTGALTKEKVSLILNKT